MEIKLELTKTQLDELEQLLIDTIYAKPPTGHNTSLLIDVLTEVENAGMRIRNWQCRKCFNWNSVNNNPIKCKWCGKEKQSGG